MTRQIDFYFDFSSPYGYLASTQIDALEEKHGVSVRWRPFLLGAVFKITGVVPLALVPLKGDYFFHDIKRSARLLGVPLTIPPQFPFGTVTSCRAFYLMQDENPAAAVRLAKALFHAAFAEGKDICPVEQVGAIAAQAGFDGDAVMTGIQRPDIKERLKREVEEAISRGVFGSPFFIVDGEPFWGIDRLGQVDQWLSHGS